MNELFMRTECWKGARRALRGIQRNLRKYMREELLEVWKRILDEAIENAPEKSGLLKRSLVLAGNREGGTGFTFQILGTHYAYYQEHGFIHKQAGEVQGQHFIERAYERHLDEIAEAMLRAVELAVIHGA